MIQDRPLFPVAAPAAAPVIDEPHCIDGKPVAITHCGDATPPLSATPDHSDLERRETPKHKTPTHMGSENMTVAPHIIGDGGLGMGGGGGIWAILLLALLGGRRDGLLGGGGGAGDCAGVAGVAAANARFTGIEAQLQNLERGQNTAGILAAVAAVRGDIQAGTTATVAGFVNVGNKLDQGFFNMERAATANTQLILNTINTNLLADKTAKIEELSAALSNEKQTHHLEHFFRREMDDRFSCMRREFSDSISRSLASGNSAAGVGSGNGSNNVTYNLEQMIQAAVNRSIPVQTRVA